MPLNTVYTAGVLWCLLLLSHCSPRTTETECQPSSATHRLICFAGKSEVATLVYYDGGYSCAASGGVIKMEGAECVAFPLEVTP